ncbi:class I SAM-dependent methyltransferase [Candidatus Omnitrophota bacterium]
MAGAHDLKDICERAMRKGRSFDLSDCVYGETNGCCPFINRPTSYYYFLAGLVHAENLSYILEAGTHFGGSIMSMSKGLREGDIPKSMLVTIDITSKNVDGFKKYPHITRVLGDSLSEGVISRACRMFDRSIDLLYIDSLHEYEHAKRNLDVYADPLSARYVILDDIHLTGAMEKFWGELVERFRERAFDASVLVKRRSAGFGVIEWREKEEVLC